MGDSWNDQNRAGLARKHAEANKPCPAERKGGSAAHRNQQSVPRSLVGTDAYVNSRVHQKSKLQPNAPKDTEPGVVPVVRRQHP